MPAKIFSRYVRIILLTFLVAMLVPLAVGGCGSSQTAAAKLVKKIDHISIRCSDPQGLFKTLTVNLGLPVAWPLTSYDVFTTGGIYAGNTNIETLRFDSAPESTTSIYGIVFESYPLSDVIDQFKQRGADPGEPVDQTRIIDDQQVKVWTNVLLNALGNDQYIVYLCEYTPEMEASLAKRAQAATGPLGGIGLVGVKEITIGTAQPDQLRAQWKDIFAPATMSADGLISFEPGLGIRISSNAEESITGLVLEVASLGTARDFLVQKDMLGDSADGQISINPNRVQGLNITLVEAP